MVKSLRGLEKKDGITVLNGTSLNIQTHQKIIRNRFLDQFPFATTYVLFHHSHILRMWVENKYILVLNTDDRPVIIKYVILTYLFHKDNMRQVCIFIKLGKELLSKIPLYIYSLWETMQLCCSCLIQHLLIGSVHSQFRTDKNGFIIKHICTSLLSFILSYLLCLIKCFTWPCLFFRMGRRSLTRKVRNITPS